MKGQGRPRAAGETVATVQGLGHGEQSPKWVWDFSKASPTALSSRRPDGAMHICPHALHLGHRSVNRRCANCL